MLQEKLLMELRRYVESHLIRLEFDVCRSVMREETNLSNYMPSLELEDFINTNRKPSFSQVLFSYIDKRGVNDSDIYKKAGIDRRHFSKIRSNPEYRLRKNTAIALALALELNMEETDDLLSAAGYSLSDSDTFDLVIQFCLEKGIYDMDNVNQALDYFSLKPLIGVAE